MSKKSSTFALVFDKYCKSNKQKHSFSHTRMEEVVKTFHVIVSIFGSRGT